MILENKYLKKAERAQKFFELILIFKIFLKNIFLHIRNFQQINMCVCVILMVNLCYLYLKGIV